MKSDFIFLLHFTFIVWCLVRAKQNFRFGYNWRLFFNPPVSLELIVTYAHKILKKSKSWEFFILKIAESDEIHSWERMFLHESYIKTLSNCIGMHSYDKLENILIFCFTTRFHIFLPALVIYNPLTRGN